MPKCPQGLNIQKQLVKIKFTPNVGSKSSGFTFPLNLGGPRGPSNGAPFWDNRALLPHVGAIGALKSSPNLYDVENRNVCTIGLGTAIRMGQDELCSARQDCSFQREHHS